VSAADINDVTVQREVDKEIKLQEIINKTQETLAAIQEQYKVSIATSQGFGYIAAST
jgi:hypothetical protein